MNSDTLARIRKFKTSDGAFVWQPGMVEGQAATLLGYPVVEAEDRLATIDRRKLGDVQNGIFARRSPSVLV